MSASPQALQQMLAQYKSSFGGQQNPQLAGFDAIQSSLGGGAPPGAGRSAGGVNAASQLIIALMRAQKMKQMQQQQQNPQQPATPTPTQSTTLAAPAGMGAMGSTGGGDGQ